MDLRTALAAGVTALATTSLVLCSAPASYAATDVTAPVVVSAAVTPGIAVVNAGGSTVVTVDVVATDDVGVRGVVALLYQGDDADTAEYGLLVDDFRKVAGTASTWRGTLAVDKSFATGKHRVAAAAFDAAGNVADADPLASMYVKRNTKMPVFNAAPEPVRKGAPIKVGGQLTRLDPARGYVGYGGKTVSVYFRPTGGAWALQGSATTDSSGTWSRSFTASVDGTWQARFAGTSNYHAETSQDDNVDVQ